VRTPLIVANWKMYTDLSEATALVTKISQGLENLNNIEVVICPPFIWLYPIAEIIRKNFSKIKLGAQNIYFKDKGNFTGEISPLMIEKLCRYVIVGHSERRRFFSETDEMINQKIRAVLRHNLVPILCLGEFQKKDPSSAEENEVQSNLYQQLSRTLKGISEKEIIKIVIAYEPVWAIGTGQSASVSYAVRIISSLRDRLSIIYNRDLASKIKILYGGSVNSGNALGYSQGSEIDGLLVGGASLKAEEFVKICDAFVK